MYNIISKNQAKVYSQRGGRQTWKVTPDSNGQTKVSPISTSAMEEEINSGQGTPTFQKFAQEVLRELLGGKYG